MRGEALVVTISEAGNNAVATDADVNIPTAALVKLLAREEAALESPGAPGAPNKVVFSLAGRPASSEAAREAA